MPTIPTYIKCAELGCKNLRSKFTSFCIDHGGRDVNSYQGQSSKRKEQNSKYATRQWYVKRQVQLSSHPLCASCLASGKIMQAEHVDHVFPWRQLHEKAFYHNIFQSLCHSCHSSKTALEQKGIYRRYGTPNRDYKADDYRRVVDESDAEFIRLFET